MIVFPDEINKLSERVLTEIKPYFEKIDETAFYNTNKVLSAFHNNRVSEVCFSGTTGYGYNDKGRETLDRIYAEVFNTQSALVRIGFVNGTHAITAALFSAVRPGQVLLSVTGSPYDTLRGAIGITGEYRGSLKEYGIGYGQVELTPSGKPDFKAISQAVVKAEVAAVFIQRSRGYSDRPALTIEEIGEICHLIKGKRSDVAIIVDNCYGEFTEKREPTDVGADIIAGSLIKNPGGGLAPAGGYVAGREDLVEAASFRLTSPGIGGECGATLGSNRQMYQGFFTAPHTVAQALKTAVYCAGLMEKLGYKCSPKPDEIRSDIIQTVELGSAGALKEFCRGIQAGAPVDSYVTPEPWNMPGYDCPVIMAAGAFVQGASIELSADGPMREPFRAYLQGGLTLESGMLGIMLAARRLCEL